MEANEYQEAVLRTWNGEPPLNMSTIMECIEIARNKEPGRADEATEEIEYILATFRRLNAILGICGEAGEMADLLKKEIFHGHEPDPKKKLFELGDISYYIPSLAEEEGFTLREVQEANIAKLRRRYPDGFDPERSQNRPPDTMVPVKKYDAGECPYKFEESEADK